MKNKTIKLKGFKHRTDTVPLKEYGIGRLKSNHDEATEQTTQNTVDFLKQFESKK